MAIGVIAAIVLMRLVYRRDRAVSTSSIQNYYLLMGDEDLKNKVREFLTSEKKIEAIKLVHDKYKTGLLDAKNFVESLEKITSPGNTIYSDKFTKALGNTAAFAGNINEDKQLVEKIEMLLRKQNKIEAIKLVVDTKKLGLKDAKQLVEILENKINK